MYGFSYPNQGRISRRDVTKGEPFEQLFLSLFFDTPQEPTETVISLTDYTRVKLSDEVGYTTSTLTFQCSNNATQWCARATTDAQTPSYGVGSLVGIGGAINANTDVAFDVDYTELVSGDVAYKISIYCYVGGVWYG